jgi:hypothetical protein
MKSSIDSLTEFFKALNVAQRVAVIIVLALIAWDFYIFSPLASAPRKPPPTYEAGQEIDVSITLITPDVRNLACASAEVVNGRHCEFETAKQKWKSEGKPKPLEIVAPYKTTDDKLLLVADLWKEPALAKRLADDPPTVGPEHARFVANCKLKIDGKMEKLETRWQLNGAFSAASDGWVGTISNCLLSDA